MKRREFITLLGGAAAAWPLAVRAQQPEQIRRVGVLMGYAENDPESQTRIAAFVQALSDSGWSDGRNLHIDYRWASADVERIKQFAKELVALKPDVILANTTPVTAALQRETADIPIVFVIVSDPVGAGFVASLARPGGNITGFINFEDSMGGKWLELLKAIAPAVKLSGIMFNPDTVRFSNAKLAYASPDALAEYLAQCRELGVYQCFEQAGYKLEALLPLYKFLLDELIDACGMAARSRPDLQFIFKPHPNEDVSYIQNRLREVAPESVKLAVGVYIGDVLRSADALVNADCTTSIEAWLHRTPVIDLQMTKDPATGRPDISEGNWIAGDQESLLAFIDRGIADRSVDPDLQAIRAAFIEKWFDTVDGRRCEAAARALDRFVRSWGSRKKFYSISNAGGIKRVAKQTLKWLAGVPGGMSVRTALQRQRSQLSGGVYDKVISRRDVRDMAKRITPLLVCDDARMRTPT